MCGCKDIEMGSYANTVTINGVQMDRCIAYEIEYLWMMGIKTTASCCGHNKALPIITVLEGYVFHMELMGYDHQTNPSAPEEENHFWPKTI